MLFGSRRSIAKSSLRVGHGMLSAYLNLAIASSVSPAARPEPRAPLF